MTYKLNPEIAKIISPVILIIDNEKIEYESGAAAAGATFDKRYLITSLRAVEDKIEIVLQEQVTPVTNWIGEEQTFF